MFAHMVLCLIVLRGDREGTSVYNVQSPHRSIPGLLRKSILSDPFSVDILIQMSGLRPFLEFFLILFAPYGVMPPLLLIGAP